MIGKNIEFYRIKKGMTKKELAEKCQLTAQMLSKYEKEESMPPVDAIEKLAEALGVERQQFLSNKDWSVDVQFGKWQTDNKLTAAQKNFILKMAQEYFARLYMTIEIINEEEHLDIPVLLKPNWIRLTESANEDARRLKDTLDLGSGSGPVGDIIDEIENDGVFVFLYDFDLKGFEGANGTVNGRPFIIINDRLSAEEKRFVAVRELAYIAYDLPKTMLGKELKGKELEARVSAISEAFLISDKDVRLQFGMIKRTELMSSIDDIEKLAAEYGVSVPLLARRALKCGCVTEQAANELINREDKSRIQREKAELLTILVVKAVKQRIINRSRGAELLDISSKEAYDIF